FETLKENMPQALRSIPVDLIRKWEHRSWCFIDAYTQVKAFSSRRYASHR
ncbi:hypothetical protein C8Q80DRAFT_1094743, partial [Daedaleopsis nitida]